ncbi:hypothetical protein M6D81_31415 [Paenibacillus sp. J5C_2022]|uniref:hypothetical protein n=1 Tax=Paenibacillus sp. J5C2022 TaxID=2977129 RepID=UPI0021D29140|nr:hypothetical protein [Paenibacillus sp. J5C2022]MCU6713216.1 hypothetical protein [Paenibacillus sp. J5C2022]
MRLNKVSITDAEGVFNAKQVRLIDITPLYGYENNVKTSQIGYNFICLAEANGFEKVTVKLESLSNLPITPEQLTSSKEPIYVSFSDFSGRFYFSDRTKSWELTCKASRVQIIKPTQNA